MKSNAIWVTEPNKVEVRPLDAKEPAFNEVMIRTKACGVCAWDSYLFQGVTGPGPTPYPIGHEACGVVEQVGAGVAKVKPGDNVFCAGGSNAMMAEYVTMPENAVVRIPDEIEDWSAWVLEPTVCVVNLLNKLNIQPGDRVALVGAGYMGLLTVQGLVRASQAGEIFVFDKKDEHLERARSFGATEVYNPDTEEGEAKVREIESSGGVDVVIDFAASDSGYHLASRMIRSTAGKFAIGSWHRHEMTFNGTQWHLSGVTVYNLSPMSNAHYQDTLAQTYELVKRGIYEPGALVTHRVPFHDTTEVFLRSIDKEDGYLKGVVLFD